MKPEAQKLRDKETQLKTQYERALQELRAYEADCQHNFTTVYDPIYHEAYTIPGDPPGTMGVDWRGPVHVPAQTEDRWKRTCGLCGLVEFTKRFEENKKITKTPKW